jgi:hypothetical protein
MPSKIEVLFADFKNSQDTLWIFQEDKCIFKSDKDVLGPLIEYILKPGAAGYQLIIMDKVIGNAAALLSVKAGAARVYSPLGSELACKTLEQYGVEYHLDRTVPFITARNGKDMCPMEKLSLGKNPDEFLEVLRSKLNPNHLPPC